MASDTQLSSTRSLTEFCVGLPLRTAPYCGFRFDGRITDALGVLLNSALSDIAAGVGVALSNGVRSPASLGGSEFARLTRYSMILPHTVSASPAQCKTMAYPFMTVASLARLARLFETLSS